MLRPTLLVDPDELAGDQIRLAGKAYHHLFRVRRLASGATIRLVDGRGGARWAEVEQVSREQAVLRLGRSAPSNESPERLELVVGALRRERASWLVEKATELGVAAVRFVASERSPRRFGPGTLDRLRRVARAAVEQCGRSQLPELSGVHPWSQVAELAAGSRELWLLDPGAVGELAPPVESAALFIGPEGGWSAAERQALLALGCRLAGLGPRVLRVETAALAAAARLLRR